MMIILLSPFTQAENRMAMYILLMIVSMAAVIKSCIPFDALRAFICITMGLGTPCALMILPGLFEVTAVSGIMLKFIVLAGLCCLVLAMSLAGITKISGNLQKDRKSSRTAV